MSTTAERTRTMTAWQRSLMLAQSYSDAARICAAEDAAAALMADRKAARAAAAAAADPDGTRMIVAQVKGDTVVSTLHARTCTGKGPRRIPRGTIGRPLAAAHPSEVARATEAPCLTAPVA